MAPAGADEAPRQLAPGFASLDAGQSVIIVPLDIELFSISAGGVAEPRADWTEVARQHMKAALVRTAWKLGLQSVELDERLADEHAELLRLHAAVAEAIVLHHFSGDQNALSTKDGRLDWSFGDVLRPLRRNGGARYALFTFVRDSYASGERVVSMILMGALGVGIPGGVQVAQASLVDLETGRVLWFNRMVRSSGDLRDAETAQESVEWLLEAFPVAAARTAALR